MRALTSVRLNYQFGVGGCKAPELPLPFDLPGVSFPWDVFDDLSAVKRCEFKFVMQKVAFA
jgi:hypothetical protein